MLLIPDKMRIRELREQSNLSQHQLSLKAHLNGNAIYRIESGEAKRTHHLRAREIARVLNCDITEIFSKP